MKKLKKIHLVLHLSNVGTKSSDEFNVACIELGGHLPIKGKFDILNMGTAELAGHETCKGNLSLLPHALLFNLVMRFVLLLTGMWEL